MDTLFTFELTFKVFFALIKFFKFDIAFCLLTLNLISGFWYFVDFPTIFNSGWRPFLTLFSPEVYGLEKMLSIRVSLDILTFPYFLERGGDDFESV